VVAWRKKAIAEVAFKERRYILSDPAWQAVKVLAKIMGFNNDDELIEHLIDVALLSLGYHSIPDRLDKHLEAHQICLKNMQDEFKEKGLEFDIEKEYTIFKMAYAQMFEIYKKYPENMHFYDITPDDFHMELLQVFPELWAYNTYKVQHGKFRPTRDEYFTKAIASALDRPDKKGGKDAADRLLATQIYERRAREAADRLANSKDYVAELTNIFADATILTDRLPTRPRRRAANKHKKYAQYRIDLADATNQILSARAEFVNRANTITETYSSVPPEAQNGS
jgi:hypothetical protein